VILRLIELGKAGWDFFHEKSEQYRQEFLNSRRQPDEDEGFAPPWMLAYSQNGRFFSRLVLSALDGEHLNYSDAADALNLRVKHFDRLNELARGVPLRV
jgi:hypothetical protein